jgi:hypothetical protein
MSDIAFLGRAELRLRLEEEIAYATRFQKQRDLAIEALETVCDYFWNPNREPGGLSESDVEELVRAAIAKARGEPTT